MTLSKRYVPIFKGIDGAVRKLPVLLVQSGVAGPSVVISAAIHGDEVTGTAVIQSLIKRLQTTPLTKGQIAFLPILNPTGFESITRSTTLDNADLNRNFGGEEDGTAAERLAAIITKTILSFKPDFVIDLHTDSMNSIAYTLVDRPASLTNLDVLHKSVDLAKNLGFAWAIDHDDSAGYPLQKCLTGHLISQGIPAVTIELGGPLIVTEKFRKAGLESLWNFLYSQKMVESPSTRQVRFDQTQVLTFQDRIHTQSTGIIDYRVEAGSVVKKGQILGIVRNAFGETTSIIRSPADGMLFSHEDQSVVFPGLVLFTLASASKSGIN